MEGSFKEFELPPQHRCRTAWTSNAERARGEVEATFVSTVNKSRTNSKGVAPRCSDVRTSVSRSHSSGLSNNSRVYAPHTKHSGARGAFSLPGDVTQPPPVEARRRTQTKLGNGIRLRVAGRKPTERDMNSRDEQNMVTTPRLNTDAGSVSGSDGTSSSPSLERISDYGCNGSGPVCSSLRSGVVQCVEEEAFADEDRASTPEPSRYKRLTIEERLRIIEEKRDKRLERARQKFVALRATVVAPRPHTLTRVRMGNFKAVGFYESRRTYEGNSPHLALEDKPVARSCSVPLQRKSTGVSSGNFGGAPTSPRAPDSHEVRRHEFLSGERCDDGDDNESSGSALSIDRDD
ncbi:hypothetical protein, conserved [Trypanosoma brucei gambiense DAL972]|uniref:Uncharacterized protein n=2 Tax=Trypanosoma brucei TaxID=5691 RepID=C9ZYA4_TRYB9|nr:hypothetical protein, conserved [Trypanosoma brucei gambiense DAL972]RHW70412.1 hypothetical protein DPX39_090046700 [Trypanosoma brucei equiperdum]CBH14403.1 hypothetical protein, conserved [Trypanosoma brucei gambiense DAL972]|eukprot:XP_011776669.1 hypothetical protein, conserved [Trypanosoma brucei gambiense DAL972]